MEISAGAQLGPYEILSPLGAGGMGEVYRARDTRLGREVAVKVLPRSVSNDPERLRRFEQEARAASMLNHPNILVIFDIGEQDGFAYVVSELLEGSTLRQSLETAIPMRKALDYARQVARGLAAAHAKGIVHRDLKPENIFITRDGIAKILDFGLAKLVEKEVSEFDMNQGTTLPLKSEPGTVVGTVGYMSPEQARGETADFRADLFSFGAILYEMLSGQRAFKRESTAETMTAIIREEPTELSSINPNIPAGIEQIVIRCLEKAPDQRFQSAHDLEFALANASGISGSTVLRQPSPAPAPGRRVRFAVIGSLGLVIVSALAFVLGSYLEKKAHERALPQWTDRRPLTFRQGMLTKARLVPGSRNIIYSAFWDGGPVDLYMTNPESPESRSLGMTHNGLFSVSSSGELAISLGCELNWGTCIGTLARVPLTGGAPREVLDYVMDADWSPDGNSLAVSHLSGGKCRLEYPIGNVIYTSPGWIFRVRVSRDGNSVAFFEVPTLTLGAHRGSVRVVDKAGTPRTLSPGWMNLGNLAWAPSGDEVWFTGGKKALNADPGIMAVSLSGREHMVLPAVYGVRLEDVSKDGDLLISSMQPRARITRLTPGMSEAKDFYWFDWSTAADLSRDGKTILFYEWGDAVQGKPTTYTIATNRRDAVRLGKGVPLALSPDGSWALVQRQTPDLQLALLPTGTGQVRLLPRGSATEIYLAGWFPDGRRIFFSGSEQGHDSRTYIQDINGGVPQPATPEGTLAALISPDGKTFAAVDRYNEYNLVPVEGGDPTPIDGLMPGDQLLQWSSNGRALFFRPQGDKELKIFRLELASGRREIWKDDKPADPVGLIGISTENGQVRITPDGKSYLYTYWSNTNQLFSLERAP